MYVPFLGRVGGRGDFHERRQNDWPISSADGTFTYRGDGVVGT